MTYKYLFGPLPSRRLGQSLGIDVIPNKTCSMNCVYCEVGRTTNLTNELQFFCDAQKVIAELDEFFANGNHADYLTICGSGEPTLWSELGKFISLAKKKYQCKIAIITNSLLLDNQQVIENCLHADLIMPSLDSALQKSFLRLTRPVAGVNCDKIISSLADFKKQFHGEMWLEILLIAGINDSQEDILALKKAIKKINPTQTQLNTLVRPGTQSNLQPLAYAELQSIAKQLSDDSVEVGVISSYLAGQKMSKSDVLNVLKRRPCTAHDLEIMLGEKPTKIINTWLDTSKVIARQVGKDIFYSVD